MKLSKKQQALFEAVNGIDAEYIEETIAPPIHSRPSVWKRVAAVAALIILILGAALFPKNPDPLFATKVTATDSDFHFYCGEVEPYSPFLSRHPKDYCNPEWKNLDLFSITITAENPPEDILTNTFVVVEYDGKFLQEGTDDSHIYIQEKSIIRSTRYEGMHSSPYTSVTFRIYGWFYEPANLVVHLYTQENGQARLITSQSLHILHNNGYRINGYAAHDKVSDAVASMSTKDLVASLTQGDYLMDTFLASSLDVTNSIILSNNAETLLELETRPDAGSELLAKLQELSSANESTDTLEGLKRMAARSVLIHLLTLDTYYLQLSPTEKALYSELTNYGNLFDNS